MMTEDFTRLPFGFLVSGSRTIIRCPSCWRHGVLESRTDGARRCVHVETSTIDDARTVVRATDLCELAAPRSVLPPGMQLTSRS
jgi:hypothetical protein